MACTFFREGAVSGVFCGPRKRVAPCGVPGCTRPHVALCDYELATPIQQGRTQGVLPHIAQAVKEMFPVKTCDLKLCASHKWPIPGQDDRDLCPAHRKIWEQQPEARG